MKKEATYNSEVQRSTYPNGMRYGELVKGKDVVIKNGAISSEKISLTADKGINIAKKTLASRYSK